MADYYPVLKRAISSLPAGSGEARRAVYERARAALLRQLNTYDPPLSPTEITDQRLALEECIRRVESEVAVAAPPVEAPAVKVPPAVETPVARVSPPVQTTPRAPVAEAPSVPPPVTARLQTPPQPRAEPERPPVPAPSEDRGQPRIGAGVSALARTLRQANSLGQASSTAARAARKAYDEDNEEPPVAERGEPALADGPRPAKLAPPADERAIEPPLATPIAEPSVDALRERDVAPTLQWPTEPSASHRRGRLILLAGGAVLLAAVALAAVMLHDQIAGLVTGPGPAAVVSEGSDDGASADNLAPKVVDRLPTEGDQPPVAPDAHEVKTENVPVPNVDPDLPPPPAGGAAPTAAATPAAPAPITPAPVTPVVTADAGAALTPPAAAASTPATTDQTQAGVLVAQRAILYEEPIPGSPGTKLEGRVLWSFVTEPPLPGEKPIPQIRGVIEVPDNKMSLKLSIHRNTDQALPASHIVELNFTLPASFPGRSIDMTPGLIAKQTEEARGDPIVGAVAKVSDNIYWLALSGLSQDVDRNVSLLKTREWIDIPIRYGNRRRAILTFEKGVQGDKVFDQAFSTWSQ